MSQYIFRFPFMIYFWPIWAHECFIWVSYNFQFSNLSLFTNFQFHNMVSITDALHYFSLLNFITLYFWLSTYPRNIPFILDKANFCCYGMKYTIYTHYIHFAYRFMGTWHFHIHLYMNNLWIFKIVWKNLLLLMHYVFFSSANSGFIYSELQCCIHI